MFKRVRLTNRRHKILRLPRGYRSLYRYLDVADPDLHSLLLPKKASEITYQSANAGASRDQHEDGNQRVHDVLSIAMPWPGRDKTDLRQLC